MKIAVVLVTYNRISDLKKALKKYEEQLVLPQYVLVVNNASTDGTKEFLDEWFSEEAGFEKVLIHNPKNEGGSGGFYLGLKKAATLDCDYVSLADDDAFADTSMIKSVQDYYYNAENKDEIAAMCTSVINHGKVDCMHRRSVEKRLLNVKCSWIPENEYKKDFFEVDELSFVGAIIKKDVIKKIGLPCKEYFIYFDDTEYSTRLRKQGKIICIPKSIMYHDSVIDGRVTWKNYYVERNSLDYIKKHYPVRYYYSLVIFEYLKKCTILAKIYKNRTKAQRIMFKTAIKDSLNNRIDVSSIYKPGVDIEKL